MTDVKLLKQWITDSGKKKIYLAEKCGLSRAGFLKKCSGKQEFKASEINILCAELEIKNLEDKENIFFVKQL